MSILEVKGLDFSYGEESILENISFNIEEGDYFGVVGPNGCGKSTLLKILLGLLENQRGDIYIFGKKMNEFADWSKVGYVSQKSNSFNSNFPATVEEVIKHHLKNVISDKAEIKRRIDESLEMVNMGGYKKRHIGNLSGGQQQRVFIARALSTNPKILFLDEPTVGIDYKSQQEFYDIMDSLNKKGMSIFMVSHDIGIVMDRVNKVACMGNGKLHIHLNSQINEIEKHLKNIYGKEINFMAHNH